MAKFCMNCGFRMEDNAAFCTRCGRPAANMPQSQNQPQQMQAVPQQRTQSRPVQQPVYQQPVYQQPVQPVVQPYQQSGHQIVQPQQPVQPAKREPKAKGNGMCSAGFVLSLLGIFLFGITSVFGLLFSVFGLISAGKKGQDGKGKAVAGIIMSVLMLAVLLVFFIFLKDPLMDKYEQATGRTFPTRKVSVDFGELFEEKRWVVLEEETCLKFNTKDGTFNHYFASQETDDFYMTGHYKLYSGKEALRHIQKDSEYADIKDWVESYIDDDVQYQKEKLILLVCDYEEFIYNGESQNDFDKVTEHFYGFYSRVNTGEQSFTAVDMHNLEAESHFTLIAEEQFVEYMAASESESTDDAD